ncbi:unnamed protein product [Somion occarium]|uniref:Yeast cell wall synthesis Kre9/Knh1-like N-terminal domain-containing protein n=1 Tax=Somion occarium TaxID=3059160 RepID=A0ABP1CIC4_9APHY
MFALVSTLAVLVPFVSAFTFSTPTDWHSSSQVVANWTTLSTDPTSFSLELNNPDLFHQALALGNNVDTSSGTLSFALGVVPASSGYTLQAVNVTNINQIFAESAPFSILDPISTSSSASSTSSGLSSASSGTGSTRTVPAATTSSTPFGVTVSNSTSAGTSPSPTSFNGNGALPQLNFNMATWAVVGLTTVFGCMTVL